MNQGRLEVCVNGAWGSVCDSRGVFTTTEAVVACRQLGILQVEGNTIDLFCDRFESVLGERQYS